ncbi:MULTISPECIES: amino acid ABC transporter permease [unclassified Brachybacterium]|uniref:amino acid ABC transporter permease n=1 Tax=unclassified Brachybacterium TaxID=2623841 RepID=UPI00360698B8
MTTGPVLYDVAGPAERRRSRLISGVLTVVLLVGAGLFAYRLYLNGVFDDRWAVLVDVPTNFAGFETRHVWQAIFRGLGNTLLAAVIALPLAALLAVVLVSVRASPIAPLRWLATGIIEIFRGLPVVLVMFFGILVLPGATPLMAVVFGLVLYNSAVFAEILRAGITALPKGQTEAAQSVGMGPMLIYRDIQLPQAVRMMLPSLIAQGVVLVKDSSLGYIVGYAELLRGVSRVSDALTNAAYLLPLLAVGAAIYIALNITLSRVAVWVQHRSSLARKAPARVTGAAEVPD